MTLFEAMINRIFSTLALLFTVLSCQAQYPPERLQTPYAPLNDKLSKMVTPDSLAISPEEAQALQDPIYLDAREVAEYEVSHLPGAMRIGYDAPKFKMLKKLDKDRPVVVYCTIGYRSERMAAKLRKRGFQNVYNLYGSIYAWSLAGLPLVGADGQPTEMIHTYNKEWGSYFPDEEKKTY